MHTDRNVSTQDLWATIQFWSFWVRSASWLYMFKYFKKNNVFIHLFGPVPNFLVGVSTAVWMTVTECRSYWKLKCSRGYDLSASKEPGPWISDQQAKSKSSTFVQFSLSRLTDGQIKPLGRIGTKEPPPPQGSEFLSFPFVFLSFEIQFIFLATHQTNNIQLVYLQWYWNKYIHIFRRSSRV